MKDINLEEKNYLLIFLLKLHYQITQIDQNYLSTVVLFEHLYIMYMEILILCCGIYFGGYVIIT
jgi:hypothetical protein